MPSAGGPSAPGPSAPGPSAEGRAGGTGRRSRRRLRVTLAAGAALALVLSPVGPGALRAIAAPVDDPGAFPSRQQVDQAKDRARSAATEVARIQARLAAASHRLHRLDVAARMAVEKYDTAVYKRQLAAHAAAVAREKAGAARRATERKRQAIARFAASTYQHDSGLQQLSSYLAAEDPARFLDRARLVAMVSSSFAAAYGDLQASRIVADQLDKQAARALAAKRRAADAASAAKRAAEAAQAEQQRAVGGIQQHQQRLQAELATAERAASTLSTKRQQGLAEQARERAERARERAERAEQARERAEQARQRAEQRERERQRQRDRDNGGDSGGGGTGDSGDTGGDTGDTGDTGGGGGETTAAQGLIAVSFARAQLGEPYVFGAIGPNTWDCSGLTMRAWQSAGVYMPHFARGQYWQSETITQSELRPGDLLYWADNPADSNTIYHVAMYIGGGQMIQAPRPGRNVEIQSMWYMGAPSFIARPR